MGDSETELEATVTGTTRGGREWVPTFIVDLDQSRCIGCGRCYKVCPRDVFTLVERDFGSDDDDDDDDEDGLMEEATMVMAIADGDDCIGCGACARICPRDCHEHAAPSAA